MELVPQLLNRPTLKQVAEASHFRIVRSISGIGFRPVALKMTGWKPIPFQKSEACPRIPLACPAVISVSDYSP